MSEPAEHPDRFEDRSEPPHEDRATEPIAPVSEDTPALATAPVPQPPPYPAPPPDAAPPPYAAPPPDAALPQYAASPPVAAAAPPVAVAPTSARRSGLFASRWVLSATTGVAGLLIGVIIGAVGVGLIGLIRHHGGPLRGDNRGQYQPDHRPGRGGLPNGNQPAPGFH